jgi:hypothetical protein
MLGRRLGLVLAVAVASLLLGVTGSAAVSAGGHSAPPPGYHRVTVKRAGVTFIVPNNWKTQKGSGADYAAGDESTGQVLLVGLKKKGVRQLPDDPTLQDFSIAGRPAKVGVETDSGEVATSFYLLSKKGGVLIVCTGPTDARQDSTFQKILGSVTV